MPKTQEYGRVHILNTPYYITLFNLSQNIIVSAAMGLTYLGLNGVVGSISFWQAILVVILGALLNSIIVSILNSLLQKESFFANWVLTFKGLIGNILAVGTIGIIIALAFVGYGYGAVLLFFGPLLLARHSFKLYIEVRNLYISTIEAFNSTLEAKDAYTFGHSSRVGHYAVILAEDYGLSHTRIQTIKDAAVLHDIGKIGINDNILNKEMKLTNDEYSEIKKHPALGADIITNVDFLRDVAKIVRHHHERYDGNGYPDGLGGDQVPIESYILALADSYDAMTTNRPYREALSKEESIEEIRKHSGTQFHPDLAEHFIKILIKEEEDVR